MPYTAFHPNNKYKCVATDNNIKIYSAPVEENYEGSL